MKTLALLAFVLSACVTDAGPDPADQANTDADVVEDTTCPRRPPPSCIDPPEYFPEENPKFLSDGTVIVTDTEYAKIREFKDRAAIWIQCRLDDDRYGR